MVGDGDGPEVGRRPDERPDRTVVNVPINIVDRLCPDTTCHGLGPLGCSPATEGHHYQGKGVSLANSRWMMSTRSMWSW